MGVTLEDMNFYNGYQNKYWLCSVQAAQHLGNLHGISRIQRIWSDLKKGVSCVFVISKVILCLVLHLVYKDSIAVENTCTEVNQNQFSLSNFVF